MIGAAGKLVGRAGGKAGDEIGAVCRRIGDAVASRNIHAAIYDALRLCVVI